ncbi:MAG TPA: hypothetical protein VH092_32960 [Urbifossiella sp.]|jgi:hypothetical protein|nr:hypothetical protein [Urbifossiella sp.]
MIRRLVARGPLALALFAGTFVGVGLAQPPGGPDRVYYAPKKGVPVKEEDAELKADATGVKVINSGKVSATVTAADIVRTYPLDVPGVDRPTAAEPVKHEIAREWEKARAGYEGIKEKFKTNAPDRLRRWLAFRIAYTTTRAADDTPADSGWKDKAEAGLKLLSDYLSDYPGGWEAWAATRTAARVSLELGKAENAARLWAKEAKAPDITPDLRVEAAYQEADALMRAGRFPEAAAKAAEAVPKAAPGAPKERLNLIVLAAKAAESNPLDGVAAVEAEIGKTKDAAVRAAGYALEGELYLAAKKPREAMWAFLWVEVVYNHDKEEVAKALARLTEVFKLLGDEDRERGYHDRMRRNRGLLL